ncbi:MAG: hypothetical protein JJU15_12280 [Pararhodobacter sp.]|nr:hypothetical protein [Pararhodobacter sp.]
MALSPVAGQAEPLALGIATARTQVDGNGINEIHIELDKAGRDAFHALTRENVARTLDILIDGRLAVSAMIRVPIPDGRILITSQYSAVEAAEIVRRLQDGSATATARTRN